MNIGILQQKESDRCRILVWAREKGRFTLADAMKAFGMPRARVFSRMQELESRRAIRRTGAVRERFTEFEVAA